jgi:hypothetical protein
MFQQIVKSIKMTGMSKKPRTETQTKTKQTLKAQIESSGASHQNKLTYTSIFKSDTSRGLLGCGSQKTSTWILAAVKTNITWSQVQHGVRQTNSPFNLILTNIDIKQTRQEPWKILHVGCYANRRRNVGSHSQYSWGCKQEIMVLWSKKVE